MPSPAEQPHGSRPWWREPLPADEREPAAADQPGPSSNPAPSNPAPSWVVPVAGPADATILMHPISDATRELPPVPAEPDRFVAAPPAVASPPMVPGQPGQPGQHVTFGGAPPAASPDARGNGLCDPEPTTAAAGLRGLLAQLSGPDGERRGRLVTVGGAALAIVLVLAGAGLLVSRLHDDRSASGGGTAATAVDLTTVRGSASSVQRPDGGISYDVANTLDGDLNTAWNSDGAKDGRGPGIALTYQFANPVNLRSITIRNGYQKVRAKDGVDLWPLNERIRQLEVVTDTGTWTWTLPDSKDPQTLQQNFGRTRTVRLKIVQIYPSQRYKDVAISEIAFIAMS